MPTMSYCAFENTGEDMEICVEKLMEAVDTGYIDWNGYEIAALPHLVKQAQWLVKLYDKFVTMDMKRSDEDEDEYGN